MTGRSWPSTREHSAFVRTTSGVQGLLYSDCKSGLNTNRPEPWHNNIDGFHYKYQENIKSILTV